MVTYSERKEERRLGGSGGTAPRLFPGRPESGFPLPPPAGELGEMDPEPRPSKGERFILRGLVGADAVCRAARSEPKADNGDSAAGTSPESDEEDGARLLRVRAL